MESLSKFLKRKLNRRFERIERKFARYQGKGFIEDDPSNEVALVERLLGRRLQLGIDVGGNRGDYSAALRKCFPDMDIHIFEPSVTNIQKLIERFHEDKKSPSCQKRYRTPRGWPPCTQMRQGPAWEVW